MDLIALRHMTYATRRLVPGDRFAAPSPDARILIAIRKARTATEGGEEAVAATDDLDPLPAVRKQYHEVVGKQPYHGWDVETLKTKIAAAKA